MIEVRDYKYKNHILVNHKSYSPNQFDELRKFLEFSETFRR